MTTRERAMHAFRTSPATFRVEIPENSQRGLLNFLVTTRYTFGCRPKLSLLQRIKITLWNRKGATFFLIPTGDDSTLVPNKSPLNVKYKHWYSQVPYLISLISSSYKKYKSRKRAIQILTKELQ